MLKSATAKAGSLARLLTLSRGRARVLEALVGYLFMLPLLLVFGVYYVYSIARSIWMSFTNYQFLSSEAPRFVGFRNYIMAVQDTGVQQGFLIAGYFTILYYIGSFLLPLIVALVLDRVAKPRLAAVYRILIYIPAVVPGAMVYRLWRWIYSPSIGLLNYVAYYQLHLLPRAPNWLGESDLILPSVVSIHWWWAIGLMTTFFLVGLADIPEELYESAKLDGANAFQLIRHVTLPLLKGTLLVWAVLRIGIFSVTEPMLILFQGSGSVGLSGGIPSSIQTWGWYAYSWAFLRGTMNMGYGAAIGWLGAIVMIVLAFAMRRLFLERER